MGGAPFTPDLNLTRWLLEVPGIIDCTADPLYFILTPSRFLELLPTTIREVSNYVLIAIGWYYQYNTRPGYMDQKTKKLLPYLSILQRYDIRSTLSDIHYSGKGGSLQWCSQNCSCESTNWYLHLYSCPLGYQNALLQQASVSYSKQYQLTPILRCASVALGTRYTGMWRQGIWSQTRTGDTYLEAISSLPTAIPWQEYSLAHSIFTIKNGLWRQTLCSNDYKVGSLHSVKFGGFHSCRIGSDFFKLAFKQDNNVY